MTDNIEFDLISRRRVLSLFGISAALGFAVPATVLTVSDAEAQTAGMVRRQERRENRRNRREVRREGRQERRETRRDVREQRREAR